MNTLKVGIVGFGEIARYHLRHLTAAGADVVGAVTSRTVEPPRRRFVSLAEMLPHVDAVTIAVPNHLHAAAAIEAIEAGRVVFVEKPLCLTRQELDAIEAVLAGGSQPLHVGFRLRFNPALRALRDRVGAVRRIRCVYRLDIARLAEGKPWTRRDATSGGAFFTLGVHALDLARWIARAGDEPLQVIESSELEHDPGADFPLMAHLRGTLRSGTVIEAGADLRSGEQPFRLELAIDADGGTYPDPSLPRPWPEEQEAADVEYGAMMAAFVRACERGERDRPSERETLQVHRDLVAARALASRVA